MATTFYLGQGDELPVIAETLTETDGTAIDLTSASVELHYALRSDPTQTHVRTAVVVSNKGGQVRYSWTEGDADVIGVYNARWVITFASGAQRQYPNYGYNTIIITSAIVWPSGDAEDIAGTSSLLTTKGDLHTFGAANARLPVGTDGQVLTADHTAATGLKWATVEQATVDLGPDDDFVPGGTLSLTGDPVTSAIWRNGAGAKLREETITYDGGGNVVSVEVKSYSPPDTLLHTYTTTYAYTDGAITGATRTES